MPKPRLPLKAVSSVSLDTWAVVLSLTLALLVKVGVLKSIAW